MADFFRQPVLWAFCIGIEVNDMKQPEAMRIADLFEVFGTNELAKKAAAELRRLHAENLQLRAALEQHTSGHDKTLDELRISEQDVRRLRSAVHKLHAAKGRYHTQLAACDLYDLCDLKNERPTK